MPSNEATKAMLLERDRAMWSLRCRGWSEQRIADQFNVHQGTVSRSLGRMERRTLRDLNKRIATHKLALTQHLYRVIDDCFQAYERSQKPASRVRTAPHPETGEKVQTTEATTRDGDPTHLHAAMSAMDRIREIWRVDEPPAKADDGDGPTSYAAMVQRIRDAEAAHDDERGPGDTGGDPPLPDGPGPVQPGDPGAGPVLGAPAGDLPERGPLPHDGG